MIFQGRDRPQGNIVEKEIRLFPKKHDFSRSRPPAGQRSILTFVYFRKITIKPTCTKLTFVYFRKITIFQGQDRPQGNGDKTDLRLVPRNYDFPRSGALQVLKNWQPNRILKHLYTILNYFDQLSHWKPRNCSKTSKLISNPPQNLKLKTFKTNLRLQFEIPLLST